MWLAMHATTSCGVVQCDVDAPSAPAMIWRSLIEPMTVASVTRPLMMQQCGYTRSGSEWLMLTWQRVVAIYELQLMYVGLQMQCAHTNHDPNYSNISALQRSMVDAQAELKLSNHSYRLVV